jgi:hypothetical protein
VWRFLSVPAAKPAVPPDRLALTALLLVAGILVAGDFRVVLANSTADDSPVLFGRFLAEPQRFQNDLLHTFGYVYALGTAVHWLPALLHGLTGLPLAFSAYAITLLQTILLGLALHALARFVSGDPWKAWLTACFGLAAEFYIWNLANFGSQMNTPYAGHLVLAFVLFGLTDWLRDRPRRSALWLSAGALVHPTITLLTLGLVVGHTVLRRTPERWSRDLILLAAPFALALIPPLLLQARYGGDLPEAVVSGIMRSNVHMNPFRFDRFYNTVLPTVVSILVLTAFGALRSNPPGRYRTLLLDAALYSTILGVAHFIAVTGQIATVMTLIPLRFTMVLMGLCLPLAIGYLTDAVTSGPLPRRWAGAMLMIVPTLSSFGVLTGAVAALASSELPMRDAHRRTATWSIFGVWAALVGIAYVARLRLLQLLIPGSRIGAQNFLLLFAIAGLIAWLGLRQKNSSVLPKRALCAILAGLLLTRNAVKGAQTLGGDARDLYEAQDWARRNTPRASVFLLEPNISWRVGADRAVVEAMPPALHVYSRRADAHRMMEERAAYLRRRPWINEANILEFARQFGGHYVVRHVERPPVFESVYRNQTYAIYRLPTSDPRP